MTGKSNDPFAEAFNRMVASYFWSPPDKGFMKAKLAEYRETLGKYPTDVLNEAISLAKEESDAMPGTATLTGLCKKIIDKRSGVHSAVERQVALEADGEKSKTEFIKAWERLERFNKWELGQIQEDAEQKLKAEGLFPNLGKSSMPCPRILIRQKMIQIAKERGVI